MKRFSLFSLLVMLLASLAARAAVRPNIVVVLADQWRAQAFGFAGDPNGKTPNFDRRAGESVRFVNAVAGIPDCSPTRASLLTGQRPITHGVSINEVPLNPDAVTLPKVLKAAGYDTAAIGKWHLDGHGRSAFIPRERRQGFDYWKVLECTHNYTDSIFYGDTAEKRHWSGYDALDQTRDTCVAPFGEFERRNGGREYRGLRTAHHTYVRDLNGPWLLFDNDADPYQQNNLVDQPTHAALQTELDAQLLRKLKANGDAFLPVAEYIRQRGYIVDANGTAPYEK